MTVDHESVTEKKAMLVQSIRSLKKLRTYSVEKMQGDEILTGAVLHYLTIGIESILDIGSHILTEDFRLSPETYEEVIVMLGREGVINKSVAQQSTGMGKFRNKMIHEYADINIKKVHGFLEKAPEIFEGYNRAFGMYLRKKKKK